LLSGLAGDAEAGTDLGPGVTAGAQALDGLGDGGVDLVAGVGHEAKCFHVAVTDAASVGVQDAADECGVLDLPPRTFRVNPALTVFGRGSWAAGDVLESWPLAYEGNVRCSSRASIVMALARYRSWLRSSASSRAYVPIR
jgi:hypothetical protein